jgi:hypothetical protein
LNGFSGICIRDRCPTGRAGWTATAEEPSRTVMEGAAEARGDIGLVEVFDVDAADEHLT